MREVELRIETLPVAELVPYAGNAKRHPEEQVRQIAASIEEFGNCDPIAVWTNANGEPEIVEGHGRLMALESLGIKTAPVIYLDHLSDEQRRAYVHVHNQTTLSSGFDFEVLEMEMGELDFDWESFGFDGLVEIEFDGSDVGGLVPDGTYTMDTNVPHYEPSGDAPGVGEIVDTEKAERLMAAIEASSVSEEEKAFLRLAACRHYAFDYQGAAEYYAGASEEMQSLMEQSALVIIDIKDAIKYGYAKLSEDIERMVAGDE